MSVSAEVGSLFASLAERPSDGDETCSGPRGRLLEVLERKKIERRATTDTTSLRPRPGARAANWSGGRPMKTALSENEAEPLNALRRYQILDAPPEPAFDRIAEMAANLFRVPMAGVSLVDEDRV